MTTEDKPKPKRKSKNPKPVGRRAYTCPVCGKDRDQLLLEKPNDASSRICKPCSIKKAKGEEIIHIDDIKAAKEAKKALKKTKTKSKKIAKIPQNRDIEAFRLSTKKRSDLVELLAKEVKKDPKDLGKKVARYDIALAIIEHRRKK